MIWEGPLSQDGRDADRCDARRVARFRRHLSRRDRAHRYQAGYPRKGVLLKLRFELDQYINLRPVKLYPGVECPLKGQRAARDRLLRDP